MTSVYEDLYSHCSCSLFTLNLFNKANPLWIEITDALCREGVEAMNENILAGSAVTTPRYGFALFLAMVVSIGVLPAGAHGETFTGRAVNGNGALEYIEHHYLEYENGNIRESRTIYYDPHNQKIGYLISEYSHGPQFGSYDFRDFRAEYQDGAKVTPHRIQLFKKEGSEEDAEETYLPRDTGQIVGQGIHHFIVYNLEAISRGEIIEVKMVLPSRLDQYDFRIRKLNLEGDTLHVRLEIDNWFLRLFAPHMDCVYDMKTGRLLRYEGISNLTDGSGNYAEVVITYSYET